jgi:hypothetical protein
MKIGFAGVVLAAFCGAEASVASGIDVWDRTGDDASFATETELVPGSSQIHDLDSLVEIDEDWFRFTVKGYSSYEVVVDGTTAGLANVPVERPGDALGVQLVVNGNSAPSQAASGSGASRSLRVANHFGNAVSGYRIRVGDAKCGGSCTADEQYRIRFRDTTYSVPRFNNTGTQTTIMILQNNTDQAVSAWLYYFDAAGLTLGASPAALGPRGSLVFNTALAVDMAGRSGSIRIVHDGPYGSLSGKAVALEPSTGFTFDTAMLPNVE